MSLTELFSLFLYEINVKNKKGNEKNNEKCYRYVYIYENSLN